MIADTNLKRAAIVAVGIVTFIGITQTVRSPSEVPITSPLHPDYVRPTHELDRKDPIVVPQPEKPCFATYEKFLSLKANDHESVVNRKMGCKGSLSYESKSPGAYYQSMDWKGESFLQIINVVFVNHRLNSKTQLGLNP